MQMHHRRLFKRFPRLPHRSHNPSPWAAYAFAPPEAVVQGLVGKAYAGHVDATGGLVIESADGCRRVDLRYESILRDVWNDSVREVAEILWPSRKSKP